MNVSVFIQALFSFAMLRSALSAAAGVWLWCELKVELWVLGAQGRRPGFDPFYNKASGELRHSQVTRRTWQELRIQQEDPRFSHTQTEGV